MPVSKRRKRRPPITRLRCPDCGALTDLDRSRYALAFHLCDTGVWRRIPNSLVDRLNRASDEVKAELLGVSVEEHQTRMERIRQRRAAGAA